MMHGTTNVKFIEVFYKLPIAKLMQIAAFLAISC
jgi:hypothetical protein